MPRCCALLLLSFLWLGLGLGCGPPPEVSTAAEVDNSPVVQIEPSHKEPVDSEVVEDASSEPLAPEDSSTGEGDRCKPEVAGRLYGAIQKVAQLDLERGLREVGFGCRVLGEGEKLTVPLQIDPGKCFAFVAKGDVAELSLALKPNLQNAGIPGLGEMVLALDADAGDTAVVGRDSCFKNPLPLPMPAFVEVAAAEGSGGVAVSLFSK